MVITHLIQLLQSDTCEWIDKYSRQLETAVTALESPSALSRLRVLHMCYQKGTLISDKYLKESSFLCDTQSKRKRNSKHLDFIWYARQLIMQTNESSTSDHHKDLDITGMLKHTCTSQKAKQTKQEKVQSSALTYRSFRTLSYLREHLLFPQNFNVCQKTSTVSTNFTMFPSAT